MLQAEPREGRDRAHRAERDADEVLHADRCTFVEHYEVEPPPLVDIDPRSAGPDRAEPTPLTLGILVVERHRIIKRQRRFGVVGARPDAPGAGPREARLLRPATQRVAFELRDRTAGRWLPSVRTQRQTADGRILALPAPEGVEGFRADPDRADRKMGAVPHTGRSVLAGEALPCGLARHAEGLADPSPGDAPCS